MSNLVRNYQLSNVEKVNKASNLIKKIKDVSSAYIDKEKQLLRLELNLNDKDKKFNRKMNSIELDILKILKSLNSESTMELIVSKELYRKVLYLNGLDCGHCAAKIESLAKKTLNYEKLLVDFASFRFIIESADKEQNDKLIELVTEIAHKVDDKIVVTEKVKQERVVETKASKTIKIIKGICIALGILALVVGSGIIIDFDISRFGEIFNHDDIILLNVFKPESYHQNSKETWHVIFIMISYVLIGYPVVWSFIKNIFKGKFFDEHSLMTIASIGAIVTAHYIEAIAVLGLFQLGEYLQGLAVNRCRKSIEELLKFDVKNAKLKKDDDILEVGVESVLPDDVIVVTKGEMIPLDGRLLNEKAIVDTKNLTGESLHRVVRKKDTIMAGSICMSDMIEIKVIRPYSESMISKIMDMVENASTYKAKAENFITKFSKFYTPVILILAVSICLIGYFFEINYYNLASFKYDAALFEWIYRSMVFLVISCPCAIVISVPLCFFIGIGISSKRGILIKGSNYLEALNNVDNIIFDKTGTLTKGQFKITDIVPSRETIKKEDVLRNLVYVEFYSKHPIGVSIVDEYGRDNVFPEIISDFASVQGGAKAYINGIKVMVGNYKLMSSNKIDVPKIKAHGLVLYIVKDNDYLGYVVIGDEIREEAKEVIKELRKDGVKKFYILTGDFQGIAEDVAEALGVDEVYAELLPDEKLQKLEEIKTNNPGKGKTVYLGDGINDAPSIAASDIGFAMGKVGSDATIAIADVVIMSDDLTKLPEALKVARVTRRKVLTNIIFSLAVKVIVVLLSIIPNAPLPLWLAIFSDVGVSLIAIFNSIFMMGLFNNKEEEVVTEDEEE